MRTKISPYTGTYAVPNLTRVEHGLAESEFEPDRVAEFLALSSPRLVHACHHQRRCDMVAVTGQRL